jgi:hypothetical protein
MTRPDKFSFGNWLELIPRDPDPSFAVLVGQILRVDPPDFWIGPGGAFEALRFRLDENAELAVNTETGRLYEVGRSLTAEEYARCRILLSQRFLPDTKGELKMDAIANQSEFKGWAKVEVMGHQSHIGYVETQVFGGAVLFRVDRPELPSEDDTLTETSWIGNTRCSAGSVIRRAAIPAATVLVGAASIYRIIPCDEATAMRAIRSNTNRPLFIVKLAEPAILPDPDDDESDDPLL